MRNCELPFKRDCISASAMAASSSLTCVASRNCFCNLESFKTPLCSFNTCAASFFHFILFSLSSRSKAIVPSPVRSLLVTARSSASLDGGTTAAVSGASDALCFLALCDDSSAATGTASIAALLPLLRPFTQGVAEAGCGEAAVSTSAASLPFWSFAAALACTQHTSVQ